MSSVLIFIAILGFLVIAHELGHFVVAKINGVKVLEFGLGYPPRVFGFKYGETTYSLNLLPLGGFVRMHGEERLEAFSDPRAFTNKGPFARLSILAAGAIVNAILPIFLFTFAAVLPQELSISDVIVTKVENESPAQTAGILRGDAIRLVDGESILTASQLQKSIYLKLGTSSDWEVERQGRIIETSIKPRVDPPPDQGPTGVAIVEGKVMVSSTSAGFSADRSPLLVGDLVLYIEDAEHKTLVLIAQPKDVEHAFKVATEHVQDHNDLSVVVWRKGVLTNLDGGDSWSDFVEGVEFSEAPSLNVSEPLPLAFWHSFNKLFEILRLLKNEALRVITGSTGLSIAGPIGIAQMTGEIADDGFVTLITWTALLSINLAIINLLPIPALDGGRILFVLIELLSGGRRVSPGIERMIHLVGFTALLVAIVLVSAQDIRRII